MNRAVIDTTILADVLLNSGEAKESALRALSFYEQTLLPVYAIKEFKAGPLKNFVWMHNKLVTVGSYEKALDALQRMSRTPRRYTTSTAIQGLKEAAGSIGRYTPAVLAEKYGKTAVLDSILCDEMRLALRSVIMRAWKKRRRVTTDVIYPLVCYREVSPYEKRGLIELEPRTCKTSDECSLGALLRGRSEQLRMMRDAIRSSEKPEDKRRAKVLRQIYRRPGSTIGDRECRSSGTLARRRRERGRNP